VTTAGEPRVGAVDYRPLSERENHNPRPPQTYDGIPAHLRDPVTRWLRPFAVGISANRRYGRRDYLEAVQLVLMQEVRPLEWATPMDAAYDLLKRAPLAPLGLDLVDFTLAHMPEHHPSRTLTADHVNAVDELNKLLALGGSVWHATPAEPGRWRLTRRRPEEATQALAALEGPSKRPFGYLSDAWGRAYGRNPDPSGAYREAVKAVEAAAKPVVTPNDTLATLGKMIPAIRDAPQKWAFALGDPLAVAAMMEALWKGQHDRHGTDDETAPASVQQDEAEAAVQMALALVTYFASGRFRHDD
jgi:hypothetical protein